MTRVEQAIADLERTSAGSLPCLRALRAFVIDGESHARTTLAGDTRGAELWAPRLCAVLSRPDQWQDTERRVLDALSAAGAVDALLCRADDWIRTERPGEDLHARIRAALGSQHAARVLQATCLFVGELCREGAPTSAGRFILDAPAAEAGAAVAYALDHLPSLPLLEFLVRHAPARLPQIANALLAHGVVNHVDVWCPALLRGGGAPVAAVLARGLDLMPLATARFDAAAALADHDPDRCQETGVRTARALLAAGAFHHEQSRAARWLLRTHGAAALDDIGAALRTSTCWHAPALGDLLAAARDHLGPACLPLVREAIDLPDPATVEVALSHLLGIDPEQTPDRIQALLAAGLTDPTPDVVLRYLALVRRWRPRAMADQLWPLLRHRLRAVREQAARVLACLGAEAVPTATLRLRESKADVRLAAMTVLRHIGSPAALQAIAERAAVEPAGSTRDAMLRTLTELSSTTDAPATLAELLARVARCAALLPEVPATWLEPTPLPPLRFRDGSEADAATVRFLLFRASCIDAVETTFESCFELVDPATSGTFALAVLNAFVAGGAPACDRWALALAARWGDARVIAALSTLLRVWAEGNRLKLAEAVVVALAVHGGDPALMAVHDAVLRYRTRRASVGRAAASAFAASATRRGIPAEALEDRAVPWFGFEPGKPRVVTAGGRDYVLAIGLDHKVSICEAGSRTRVRALPKAVPAESRAALKELQTGLRAVAKAQGMRLEHALLAQRRWPAGAWSKLFLDHPVLFPFAVRLVWAQWDDGGRLVGTFRALPDHSLTDVDDATVTLSASQVGLVHPLDFAPELLDRWRSHLADHEVQPPFAQLDRPIHLLPEDRRSERRVSTVEGATVHALTLRGRADRAGWARGSVGDGGMVSCLWKPFPAAGVDALLILEGLSMVADRDARVTLHQLWFVHHGSVAFGNYVTDEPAADADTRVIPLGQVPPVVFSEVLGDLQAISGLAVE